MVPNTNTGVEYVFEDVNGNVETVAANGNTPEEMVETAQQKIARLKKLKRYLKRMKATANRAAMREEEKTIQKTRNRKKNKLQKASRKRNRK